MKLTVEAMVKMEVEVSEENWAWAGVEEAEDKTLQFLDQWIGDGAYDPAVVSGVYVRDFKVTRVE